MQQRAGASSGRQPGRCRHPRWRERRVRRGAAFGGARQVRRADREGQGRRHVPAPRLHPDQGPAARGRDRRRRPRERHLRRQRHLRGHRHGRRQQVQGRGRQQELQGPHRTDQEPRHRHRRGRGQAGRAQDRCRRQGRREQRHLHRLVGRPGDRFLLPDLARARARRLAGDRQRARPAAGPRPGIGDRARRRRDRLRVRVGAGRRSARRSRSSRRCRTSSRSRTRPAPSSSSAPSAAARSTSSSVSASSGSRRPTPACACTSRAATRSRPSCCWSRSAAAPCRDGLGYEEQGVTVERGFVITDEYLRTSVEGVYAVGDLVSINSQPHLQLAHVGFAEGIQVAEHIAGLPVVPIDYAGVPRITYSQPEVASVGLTEAGAVERYGAGQRQDASPTTCPATAAARSSTPRARSSSWRSRTARCSACTSSATASAS